MHLQVRTLDGCGVHQRTHLLTRSLQDVHVCLCVCSLFVQRWGNDDGGFQLVYESTCCLAWGVIFDRRKDKGVVFVLSLFNAVGVYVGVCVCIRTHTHTMHRWGTRVSPGVGMRHLEGPKNLDRLNLGTYIFVYVYKVHTCV